MVDASSSGRVAPRIKSIDVRANLLSQRLAERQKMFQAARARFCMLAAVVIVGALLLPWLYRVQNRAAKATAAVMAERNKLTKTVDGLQAKADLVEPRVRQQEMITKCQRRADAFLAQYVVVMNAVSSQIVLNDIKGEVLGGDLKLSTRADAETFGAVENYVRLASAGAAAKDAGITSSKRSDALRKAGINFEFTKKIGVGS